MTTNNRIPYETVTIEQYKQQQRQQQQQQQQQPLENEEIISLEQIRYYIIYLRLKGFIQYITVTQQTEQFDFILIFPE